MGDIIIAGMLVVAAAVVGFLIVRETGNKKIDRVGQWFIDERDAGYQQTGVYLVRRYQDREGARILVAKIRDDAPDWTDRYEEAMAQARERLTSLRDNK